MGMASACRLALLSCALLMPDMGATIDQTGQEAQGKTGQKMIQQEGQAKESRGEGDLIR